MIFTLLIIFTMTSSSYTSLPSVQCPDTCQCSTVNSLNVTICEETGFKSIPTTIDHFTNFLDMSGNDLGSLQNYTFSNLKLVHLVSLDLRRSGVRGLNRHTFSHLRSLKILDISENLIVSIDPFIFADNKVLEMVNFSGNPISTLNTFQFTALPNLKLLDFQNCQLRTIESDAFSNLLFLESLNLKNNSLTSIPKDIFTWLPNLKSVELNFNAWTCDCNLQVLTISLQYRGLYSNTLSCIYEPKLSNRSSLIHWHMMDNVSDECIPLIQNNMKDMLIRNVKQGRPAIVFSFLNTTAKFSSHTANTAPVPWLLVFLSSLVISLTSICIIRMVAKMCRRAKVRSAFNELEEREMVVRPNVYRDYDKDQGPSTSYNNESFSLLDEYSSSDMSVSIDL